MSPRSAPWRHAGLFGLLFAAAPVLAQAYKWVDAEGKTHFSDTPPADRKAERIVVRPQVAESPIAGAKSRDWRTQLEESGVRHQQAQKRKEAEDRAAEAECQRARRDVDGLSNRRRVVTGYDKDGQRQYMEDKDRPAAIDAALERVGRYCR